jgi:rhodanese-related sulfurtransferase
MPAFDESNLEVTPEQTAQALADDSAQLVDVREDYEWEAGRIDGARHVELQQLSSQAETIDPERPVIFQCRSGGRSLMAAQAFRGAGYEAYSMAGGLLDWVAQGRPILPEDGEVASH